MIIPWQHTNAFFSGQTKLWKEGVSLDDLAKVCPLDEPTCRSKITGKLEYSAHGDWPSGCYTAAALHKMYIGDNQIVKMHLGSIHGTPTSSPLDSQSSEAPPTSSSSTASQPTAGPPPPPLGLTQTASTSTATVAELALGVVVAVLATTLVAVLCVFRNRLGAACAPPATPAEVTAAATTSTLEDSADVELAKRSKGSNGFGRLEEEGM